MSAQAIGAGMPAARLAVRVSAAFGAGVLGLILLVAAVGGRAPTTAVPGSGAVNTADIPAPYVPWVLAAGSLCAAISPAVIAAQDQVESGWNPRAVSSAGAEGIAQFLPSTFASWGQNSDGTGNVSPFNPADEIMAQGRYDCSLASLAERLVAAGSASGSTVSLALACYNAGPGAVEVAHGVPADAAGYVQSIESLAATKYAAASPGGGTPGLEAVAAAEAALGTPYQWGGSCDAPHGADPSGWCDCSSLVQMAWAAAGVALPRTTFQQVDAGTPVASVSRLEPGDLIFIPGSDGTASSPGHVGIYAGNGYLINAPETGQVVQFATVASWQGQIVAMRRIGNEELLRQMQHSPSAKTPAAGRFRARMRRMRMVLDLAFRYPVKVCCVCCNNGGGGMQAADLDGAAHLVLDAGVRHLDPATAVFDAMLAGWERQQRSRFLREETIGPRLALVRRFARFCGLYPWQWSPAELEAFTSSLVSGGRPLAHSTIRSYQMALQLFCGYVTDGRYGWPGECERRFGEVPAQIAHEWNSVAHVTEFEGRPGRRALTYDEVQALFDAADARVGQIRGRGRKGALAALRDAVMLKTVYAFGLRRRETVMLDLADFRRNPRAARYGDLGSVQVRYGKASRGSPPKRRTVLTVPEMDWITGVLTHWRDEVRPLLCPAAHPAVFVTERRGRTSARLLDGAFGRAAADAGLDEIHDLHSLRHSYVTHLLEFGYPALMVQQQVGHSAASTTALYTSVSDEFRNRLMDAALDRYPELKEPAR